MADELDPRLEARLREALHAEGDALPLLIREQDVLRARRRRRGRRLAVPASLLGAAAVVAVLVATGILDRGGLTDVGATPSPSPSPSERPLASYEELLGLIGPGASAALQGEGKIDAGDAEGPVETDLGSVRVTQTLKLAVSCLGGDLIVVLSAEGAELGSHRIHCSLQGPFASRVNPFAATPAVEARVVVIAPKGMRWRIALADPFGGDPSPVTGLPSPESGETPLVWLEVGLGSADVDTGVAVPDGTDEIHVTGRCAGEGELRLEIDGVRGDYPCATMAEVFVPDNTWLDIRASTTGSVHFTISIVARDLERAEAVAWIPPSLTLTGQPAAGGTTSLIAFAGCGLSWEPRAGGGAADSCGPSWQPMAAALRLRAGTMVAISLPDGWTLTAVDGSVAVQTEILPSGRAPAEQVWTGSRSGNTWTFAVPPVGDWGVKLLVSGGKDGDRFGVPYYARIIVTP